MNAAVAKKIEIMPSDATRKRWQAVAAYYQQLDGAKAESILVR
jgi:hypothetical protein